MGFDFGEDRVGSNEIRVRESSEQQGKNQQDQESELAPEVGLEHEKIQGY